MTNYWLTLTNYQLEMTETETEKQKVANIFSKNFVHITKTLNIPEWKPQKDLSSKIQILF